MDKAPIIPMKAKKIMPSDFERPYHCPHYETCMYEMAPKDRLLDCGACEYRLNEIKET